MKSLAALLHTFYCQLSHEGGIENLKELREREDICLFYLEEILDTAWECRDHKYWVEKAVEFMDLFELTEQEAVSLLTSLNGLLRQLSELEVKYPKAREVFIGLLEVIG